LELITLFNIFQFASNSVGMEKLVCVKDFAEAAERKWDANVVSYFNSGADDEITVQENRDSYNRYRDSIFYNHY